MLMNISKANYFYLLPYWNPTSFIKFFAKVFALNSLEIKCFWMLSLNKYLAILAKCSYYIVRYTDACGMIG